MPDLANFAITRNGTATLTNAPRWTISGQVVNSKTGALIRDFTGASALSFPQVFAQFAPADQDELVGRWVLDMIRKQFLEMGG